MNINKVILDLSVLLSLLFIQNIPFYSALYFLASFGSISYLVFGSKPPESSFYAGCVYPFGLMAALTFMGISSYIASTSGALAIVLVFLGYMTMLYNGSADESTLNKIFSHKSKAVIFPICFNLFLLSNETLLLETYMFDMAPAIVVGVYFPFRLLVFNNQKGNYASFFSGFLAIVSASYLLVMNILNAPQMAVWTEPEAKKLHPMNDKLYVADVYLKRYKILFPADEFEYKILKPEFKEPISIAIDPEFFYDKKSFGQDYIVVKRNKKTFFEKYNIASDNRWRIDFQKTEQLQAQIALDNPNE